MAPRVSTGPTFPYLNGSDRATNTWASALVQRLIQEFQKHAIRLNASLQEDGSEAMTGTLTGTSAVLSGTIQLDGATSGHTIITASATASGTLTLPAATDTLTGKATTDTFTNKTITSSTNKLGGVTMDLGSDATGDTYYTNASTVLTRLGIGSTGQVLTVAAGLPSWATPSSPPAQNFALLNTITISGTPTTVTDTASMTSSYSHYMIVFTNIIPGTSGATLQVQLHSGGAFKTTGYLTTTHEAFYGGSTGVVTPTSGMDLSANAALYNAAPGVSGVLHIYNPSAAAIIQMTAEYVCASSATAMAIGYSGGYWNTSGAVDGFQLTLGGTITFTSGTIKVYGIT